MQLQHLGHLTDGHNPEKRCVRTSLRSLDGQVGLLGKAKIGKTLRGSIEPAACGGAAFMAQVTLYSAALGVAIGQACDATGENHERVVLKKLLGEPDLEGVLIQTDARHSQRPLFGSSRSRGSTSSSRSRRTRPPCIARSAASSREGARSLLWQRIRRSAMAASSPGRCGRTRHRSPSARASHLRRPTCFSPAQKPCCDWCETAGAWRDDHAAARWFSVDPLWHAGGDARHHSTAGNGTAPATARYWIRP